jgi:hypothetical protein
LVFPFHIWRVAPVALFVFGGLALPANTPLNGIPGTKAQRRFKRKPERDAGPENWGEERPAAQWTATAV